MWNLKLRFCYYEVGIQLLWIDISLVGEYWKIWSCISNCIIWIRNFASCQIIHSKCVFRAESCSVHLNYLKVWVWFKIHIEKVGMVACCVKYVLHLSSLGQLILCTIESIILTECCVLRFSIPIPNSDCLRNIIRTTPNRW